MKKKPNRKLALLSWMRRNAEDEYEKLNPPPPMTPQEALRVYPLWRRCDYCGLILYLEKLKEDHFICSGCDSYLRINTFDRIESLIDDGTWRPMQELISSADPLRFKDSKTYRERLEISQERTGFQEAVQTGTGLLHGIPVALGVMTFDFMGGSMGSVVGEKITRLIEHANKKGLVLIMVCASGGARMQEGAFSLMQMAKISAALYNFQNCSTLLYISILTSPTTGGVTASFAMLGDFVIGEPQAVIGFAGRRVIEQTLGEILPENFQTAEYLMDHGLLDLIVKRKHLKQAIAELILFHQGAPHRMVGNSI
jgi:acetyl-CoA carboxylase carboxyl transferase subunit beta